MLKPSNVAETVSMKGVCLLSSCAFHIQALHTHPGMQRLHSNMVCDAALFRRFAALKALMPGHEKADKATFLNNTVAYIKQLQVPTNLHLYIYTSSSIIALYGTRN